MKVLFVTLAYPEDKKETNLYTDLISEFKNRGHDVTVVCQSEKRYNKPTRMDFHRSIPVLRVQTGNITKTNIIEKGINTLLLERKFIKAIKMHLSQVKFDLILYSTPPITFERVIRYFKQKHLSSTYLLLKDIFPQNAVDIGILKEDSFIYKYFRKKEKALYEISDFIGCMSEGNRQFLIKHNPEVNENKIEINPNTIKPSKIQIISNKNTIRKQFGIPKCALFFIYGGNLGKPQGIDFFLRSINLYKNHKDIFFLIVGSGTEFKKIEKYIELNRPINIRLESHLPKEQYEKLLQAADIGMIYLDERFTIPNIPSRLISYMDNSKPVIAVTDNATDLKDIISKAQCGYFTPSGNEELFIDTIEKIKRDRESLVHLGENGRAYLEHFFHVSRSYKIIMSHFNR